MNQNNNNNNGNGNGSGGNSGPSIVSKASYIGTGILIGLVIYPFVRKALSKIQPQMDKVFDDLTGKAEDLAEKTSDLLARAKASMNKADADEHNHDHPHTHRKPNGKSTVQ